MCVIFLRVSFWGQGSLAKGNGPLQSTSKNPSRLEVIAINMEAIASRLQGTSKNLDVFFNTTRNLFPPS